jgi:hypothetical protein
MIAIWRHDVLVKYRFRAGGKKKPLLLRCANLESVCARTRLATGNVPDKALVPIR